MNLLEERVKLKVEALEPIFEIVRGLDDLQGDEQEDIECRNESSISAGSARSWSDFDKWGDWDNWDRL